MSPITPFFGAVLICWIFSVCVHEFAHAVLAYWGGDRSVRQSGYLSFNPFYYVDPVMSILLPCIFLLMGGIPLPGGAVRIDRSALRGPGWAAAVSAAGPASNFILFIVITLVLHAVGAPADAENGNPSMWVRLLGVMAVLELFAVFLNLIPVPPFDGFGIIEAYMDSHTRALWSAPWIRWTSLGVIFMVLFANDALIQKFYDLLDVVLVRFGLPFDVTWKWFNLAISGASE